MPLRGIGLLLTINLHSTEPLTLFVDLFRVGEQRPQRNHESEAR
jgi:hypothetical protein